MAKKKSKTVQQKITKKRASKSLKAYRSLINKGVSARDKYWVQGYACAAATVAYTQGHDSAVVRELIKCAGLSKKVCDSHDVAAYDAGLLFPEED